jgi:gamma-glutamyltranspeptidase / glutathione hydrolase
MMEENLRRAMLLSRGDPTVFVTRPLSLGLLIAAVALIVIVTLPQKSTDALAGTARLKQPTSARARARVPPSSRVMSFDWKNPYPTVRTPVFARNVVATSQPLAAQAGLHVLQRGGNAVGCGDRGRRGADADEPCSNGLGPTTSRSCGIPATQQLHGLNASGVAPAAWTLDHFRASTATIPPAARARLGCGDGARRGRRLVPAAPALRQAALRRRAGAGDRLRRARLRGVGDRCRKSGAGRPACCKRLPGLGRALPAARPRAARRRALHAGRRRAHAAPHRRQGGEAFYRGEIADAIARTRGHRRRDDGGDLASYWDYVQGNGWVGTISMDFPRPLQLHEIPPNGQGIAALICLGILAHRSCAATRSTRPTGTT